MTTIVDSEARHFGAMADDWWDPKGSSAMLHRLNPVRLGFIRESIDTHWRIDDADRRPLTGKRAIDVGCGAGLLAEPLARMGADVTGIDAAPENIAAARDHAAGQGLAIDYRAGEIGAQPRATYDLVTCMEVIEHVADARAFVAALADRLAPGGLMVLSTPNRTAASRILLVEAAERLGRIPRGTHDWDKFVAPDELAGMLLDAGLVPGTPRGLMPVPGRGFAIGDTLALDYLMTATWGENDGQD